MRLAEQEESARLGGYEFVPLRLKDCSIPREACLQGSVEFHAALWRAIREFEPDYLFCPPLAVDPLVGIHNDHQTVAEAVRRVAYMINVPHAFTPEYPGEEGEARACRTPVILNVHDSYMSGANACDLVVDVEEAFETIARLSWCHQSQVREWLPWVGREPAGGPESLAEWSGILRERFARKNRELGLETERAMEVFRVTAWGAVARMEDLVRDFPGLSTGAGVPELARVEERLARWRGEG